MAAHIIPVEKLSQEALCGVVREYISRDGTDYGEREVSPEESLNRVKNKLTNGSAVLIYDDETGTTNIFPADSPILSQFGQHDRETRRPHG